MEFPPISNLNTIEQIKDNILSLKTNILSQDFKKSTVIHNLSQDFNNILHRITFNIYKNASYKSLDIIKQSEFIGLLENLFSFVIYVRDIHSGLGIRTLSYHFIISLYDSFPEFTNLFIDSLFSNTDHPSFGSWRDAIGICDLLYNTRNEHPFIDYLVTVINKTVFQDLVLLKKDNTRKTNISKWIPRENSKKKWLFKTLSIQWCETHHSYLLKHCINNKSRIRAERKCFSIYRKIVSTLSNSLQITESLLSSNNNHCISLQNTPLHSLFKNWYSLFNTSRDMQFKHEKSKKHLFCSNYLSESIKNYPNTFKSPAFFFNYFTFPSGIDKMVTIMFHCVNIIEKYQNSHPKHDNPFAITYCKKIYDNIINLNNLWKLFFDKWENVNDVDKNSIPVIDISSTSILDPTLHLAISRACFIAQASHKRIVFSAHIPIWINIQDFDDFYSMIAHIYNCINKELLINTSLNNSLLILGDDHPFTPIIINNNGFCRNYNHTPTFKDCLDIFDNARYKKIQELFQENVQLINIHFLCDL